MTKDEKKRAFNKTLFAWHKKNYREMSWRPPKSRRRDRASLDPYRILVSEIMLQQTQVERVKIKYSEFLKKFPNVQTLAKSSLGDVLRVWSGLGYNRRAKYLHECAKQVVAKGGKFPNTYEELVLLPGIGRSTAGALLAFSFGEETPMIDTNIRRILVRVFFEHPRSDLTNSKGRTLGVSDKELYAFGEKLIPKRKGRAWNYAMLDLGATLCTARNHSDRCPLKKLHGKVSDFVYKKPQKKFSGSKRFYRGRALLCVSKHQRGVTQSALEGALRENGAPLVLARLIIRELQKEKMIIVRSGKILLP